MSTTTFQVVPWLRKALEALEVFGEGAMQMRRLQI